MARDTTQQTARLRGKVVTQRKEWKQPGLVASAARMNDISPAQQIDAINKMAADGWQREVWDWMDLIPEFRYAVSWVGNLLSKAKLTIHKNGVRMDDEEAAKWLDQIYGGRSMHPEMLRLLGVHFTVAGEAYVVLGSDAFGVDEWHVVPAVDFKSNLTMDEITVGDGITFTNATSVRMWRPHPRHLLKSDAPSRACLSTLSQVYNAERHIARQLKSRIMSNGMILLPSEVNIQSTQTEKTDEDGNKIVANADATPDEVVRMLYDVGQAALTNPDSPGASLPVVVTVPGDTISKIKHLTLWSEIDSKAKEMRDDAIHRLALGMDMPPEILEGTGGLNHWASWQVEEAAIKSHTEPLLQVIATSLTTGFLHPILMADEGMGPEDAAQFEIVMDTSELKLRPNRSEEAFELFDRGVISHTALRRENGFAPEDEMNDEDRKAWLLTKLILSTSGSPEMLSAAMRTFGVDLQITPADAAAGDSVTNDDGDSNNGAVSTGDPSMENHPSRELPDPGNADIPAMLASAGDVLVTRVLERAGNRLKAKMNRSVPGVPAYRVHEQVSVKPEEIDSLLEGAWDLAPEYVSRYGGDVEAFTARLDAYARGRLTTGKPHDPRDYMSAMA